MGRPKKSDVQKSEDPISFTSSGRKIIRPGETTESQQPPNTNNSNNNNNNNNNNSNNNNSTSKKRSSKAKDSDDEQEQQNIVEKPSPKKSTKKAAATPKKNTKKQQQKDLVEVISSGDEEVPQDQPKVTKRKGKNVVPTVASTEASGSNIVTKKYTAEELAVIQSENRMVYYKFFFFSFLMVLVPIMAFKLVNGVVGDFLGINRIDRISYAGFASLGGLVSVVAAYSIMAYYEK